VKKLRKDNAEARTYGAVAEKLDEKLAEPVTTTPLLTIRLDII
jgi:hypothetical protein